MALVPARLAEQLTPRRSLLYIPHISQSCLIQIRFIYDFAPSYLRVLLEKSKYKNVIFSLGIGAWVGDM